MVGNSQTQRGLAGLGLITVKNENQEGEMASTSANSNANNQVPATVKFESSSPESFDWENSSESPVPEAEGPGGYLIIEQDEFIMPPPHPPMPIPVPDPVPNLPEDLISASGQALEERRATENMKEELDQLKMALRKKNKELQQYQNDKASLKKKLKMAEVDYCDEKKRRKRIREDLDYARGDLDEEVERRKDMENNLATVALSLEKLKSSVVRYVVGAGASLSNDVSELCRQLERKMNQVHGSYNVAQGKYLKAQETLLWYQRMYGDGSQQLRDPRIQALAPPPLPISSEPLLHPSNLLALMPSSAVVPRQPPLPPPTQYLPPPPPPKELHLEYDPRKAAATPAKRRSTPRPCTSGRPAAAGFQKSLTLQSQSFAEDPRVSVRPNGDKNNEQNAANRERDPESSGSSSLTSSAMSDNKPTPGPAPKLAELKQLVEPGYLRCHYCNHKFKDRTELFSHQKLKHDKGPHASSVQQELAAARLRNKTSGPVHAKGGIIYTYAKPKIPRFACKCGKNFAASTTLKRHIKMQSGENIQSSPNKMERLAQEIEGRQKGLQPPETRNQPAGTSSRPVITLTTTTHAHRLKASQRGLLLTK